jgi:hypothetical protein
MPKVYNPGGHRATAGLSPRVCETCGESYQPYRATQRTCSVQCTRRRPDKVAADAAYKARPDIRERRNAQRRANHGPEQQLQNLRGRIQRLYGITFEQYEAMVAAQGNRCAVCGTEPDPRAPKQSSRLHVDHDHITGAVRKLLCNRCNMGVGYFLDDPIRLRAAAEYIESHRGEQL